jgi:hypothetical protein
MKLMVSNFPLKQHTFDSADKPEQHVSAVGRWSNAVNEPAVEDGSADTTSYGGAKGGEPCDAFFHRTFSVLSQ